MNIDIFSRLTKIFHAPLMETNTFESDPSQEYALEVKNASFEWEESLVVKDAKEARAKSKKGKASEAGKLPLPDEPPFQVRDINMLVPRGSLIAIVGAVGSGKVGALWRTVVIFF